MNTHSPRWKRWSLFAFLGTISLSALIGMVVILFGDAGPFAEKVLVTSLTLSAFCFCTLASATLRESKGAKLLPLMGLILAILATLLTEIGIWTDTSGDSFWQITGVVIAFTLATAHVQLLLLARLEPRFRWAFGLVFFADYGIAFLISFMLLGHPDEDTTMRIVGALSILSAALTIAIPVFHKLSGNSFAPIFSHPHKTPQEPKEEIPMLCPFCQTRFAHRPGKVLCPKCGGCFTLLLDGVFSTAQRKEQTK